MVLPPGVYENIPFSQYITIEAVNNSTLSKLKPVPAGVLLPDVDTEDKAFGRAFHVYILEGPTAFFNQYEVGRKKPNMAAKVKFAKEIAEYVAWKAKVEAEGKLIIDSEKYATIKHMGLAIKAHPTANDWLYIQKGRNELTIIWIDQDTGQLCKGRLDRVIDKRHIDLKSARSAEKYIYRKETIDRGGVRAGIFYWEGWVQNKQPEIEKVSHIVCEKTPPFRVECRSFAMNFLDAAYEETHKLLRLYKKCKEDNYWPHYENAGEDDMEKPSWYGPVE